MIELSVMGVKGVRTERSDFYKTPRGDGNHRVTRQTARDLFRPHLISVHCSPSIPFLVVTLCPADHTPSLPTSPLRPLPNY